MLLLIIKVDGNIMCSQVYTDFHSFLTNLSPECLKKILTQFPCFGKIIFIFLIALIVAFIYAKNA